jgi:hypothetical protein
MPTIPPDKACVGVAPSDQSAPGTQMQPSSGAPAITPVDGTIPPPSSRSKLKRAASNDGSSARTTSTNKKRVTNPRATGIGQEALRVCHYGTADDVQSDVEAENDHLWVGKKACKLSVLREHYPGLCWSSLMSHLTGNSRFSVCMQPDHPDHRDFSSRAHALGAIPFAEVRQYFQ